MTDDTSIIHPDGHTSADRIPGEHDPTTLTHRQPGSIGGRPFGEDNPTQPSEGIDDATRRERQREGGGAD